MTKAVIIIIVLFLSKILGASERSLLSKDSIASEPQLINSSLSLRFTDFGEPRNIYSKTLKDFSRTILSPIYWKGKDYVKLGAILGGGAVLYYFDEPIYRFIQDSKSGTTEFLSLYVFEPIGNNTTFALLAGMAGYGLLTKNERPTTTAILAIEALMITGVVTLIPKTLAGRIRPYHTDPINPQDWRGPFEGRSFWSGHTAAAFTAATVIAEMYNDSKIIPTIAYTTAIFAGLSRIHDRKHWATDVLFGAVCGSAIGHLVVKSYRTDVLTLTPVFSPERQGIYLTYRF